MSLINDALKQAQQKRSGSPADLPPMPGSTGGTARPNRGTVPQDRNLVVAIASAAAVVLLAIALTVFAVFRTSSPTPTAVIKPAAARPVAVIRPAASSASPVIVTPNIAAPSPSVGITLPGAKPTPSVSTPAPAPNVTPTVAANAAAAGATTPVDGPKIFPGGQDIRMLTYIDALRVTGIRSSATDSKVLMNDKVYRIGDMVDYTLELRLTKVSPDGLTFTDANGVTYVKTF